MKRDWAEARAKLDRERVCRVCAKGKPHAAHVVARRYDNGGYVDPRDVVPLCSEHHYQYDARQLDLLPYLTLEEQGRAAELVGIERARQRVTGGRDVA